MLHQWVNTGMRKSILSPGYGPHMANLWPDTSATVLPVNTILHGPFLRNSTSINKWVETYILRASLCKGVFGILRLSQGIKHNYYNVGRSKSSTSTWSLQRSRNAENT